MDIQLLSGLNGLANIDESTVRQMVAKGETPPAGIPRKDGKNEVLLEKIDFLYAAATPNGPQSILSVQVQAGYKRLAAFALVTKQRNVADQYELAISLSGQQIVNRVNYALLEANAVTPVQGRYMPLNRKIDQSTIEVTVTLQGAAALNTQLTGILSGQVVFVLTNY